MCICNRNWQSNDCSERVCMFGLAHVDTPKVHSNSANSSPRYKASSQLLKLTYCFTIASLHSLIAVPPGSRSQIIALTCPSSPEGFIRYAHL